MTDRPLQLVNRLSTGVRRTAVAIVGFTDHRTLAPLGDPAWECWGLNELYRYMPVEQFSRWFELHPRADFLCDVGGDKPHVETLKTFPLPCYVAEPWPECPNLVVLPKAHIEAACGTYMTSSIAWMLGLAIAEGFQRIGLYGIDMAQDSEYCLAPETRVLGADLRWRPVGDVIVGDQVVAFDEEPGIGTAAVRALLEESGGGSATAIRVAARQWRVATVEAAPRLRQPCYRITLADGTTVVASDKHRWLVPSPRGHTWRATQDLKDHSEHRGGRPSRLTRVLPTWTDELSYERGYLAAAFDGEGSLTQHPHRHCRGHAFGLAFAQKDNAMAAEVRRCMTALGIRWSELRNGDILNFNVLGGRPDILRLLGSVRPKRLLGKFSPENLGAMQRQAYVPITKIEFIGEQDVVGLKTSEGTFIAEGFASHNSEQRPCVEYLIGLARGRGITVEVPATSDLLKSVAQYGFESAGSEFIRKLVERYDWLQREHTTWQGRLAELEKQMVARTADLREQYETQKTQMTTNLRQIEGAIDDCRYWKRSWGLQPTSVAGVPVTPDRSADARTGINLSAPAAVAPMATLAAVQPVGGDSPSGQ